MAQLGGVGGRLKGNPLQFLTSGLREFHEPERVLVVYMCWSCLIDLGLLYMAESNCRKGHTSSPTHIMHTYVKHALQCRVSVSESNENSALKCAT